MHKNAQQLPSGRPPTGPPERGHGYNLAYFSAVTCRLFGPSFPKPNRGNATSRYAGLYIDPLPQELRHRKTHNFHSNEMPMAKKKWERRGKQFKKQAVEPM
jgi:hypothetical protein